MSGVDAPLALTCKEFVEVITAYLDGTLPPTEVARVDGHLAGCAGCRAYLSQMRQTIMGAGRPPRPRGAGRGRDEAAPARRLPRPEDHAARCHPLIRPRRASRP